MKVKSKRLIKILLADGCEIFQDGIRLLFSKETSSKIKLLDTTSNGKHLVNIIKKHHPDVVIAGNRLKEMDVLSMCRYIKEKYPQIFILTINHEDEEETAYHLLMAGVDGFISRNICKQNIINAIEVISTGKPYHCPHISGKIFDLISKNGFNGEHKKEIHFSNQELKVIQLICKGYTTKEIATAMSLCTRTIDEYRNRIQVKTKVKNAAGLVAYAFKNNIVSKEIV